MAYATAQEIATFCEVEVTDTRITSALAWAKGFIDAFCHTTFDAPSADSAYVMDGEDILCLWAPDAGPFASVTKIEYLDSDGETWLEYSDDWWNYKEFIELESSAEAGNQNWRVTAKCYTQLDTGKTALLKQCALGLCKLYLVPHDEPTGRSVVSMSTEGTTYSYREVDGEHPTGNEEIDGYLRLLRRRIIRM